MSTSKQTFRAKLETLKTKYHHHYSRIRAKIIKLRDASNEDRGNKNNNRQSDKCRHSFDELNRYFDTITVFMDEDMDIFEAEVLSLFKNDMNNAGNIIDLFENSSEEAIDYHNQAMKNDAASISICSLATTAAFSDDINVNRDSPTVKIANIKKRNIQNMSSYDKDEKEEDDDMSTTSEPPSKKTKN